jgi:hypothetical protein
MRRRPALRLPKLRGILDFKGFAFAGFLLAGSFKADPRFNWLPIDMTVLFAALTILCALWAFMKNGFHVHKSLYWMGILLVLLAVPLFWTEWIPYATDKVQRFYTLTIIAAVAPFFLFKTRDDLRRFLHALTLLGLILSWNAAMVLLTNGGQIDRLTSFGSNTISLGRASGMAFVWIAVLALDKRIGIVWAMAWLGFLGVVMLGSGSRGPLLAALGAVFLLGVFHYWRHAKGFLRFLGVLVFVGSMFAYGFSMAPAGSAQRITDSLQGKVDDSSLVRIEAYQMSWQAIQINPQGTGWAGFASKVNLWGGDDRKYPHDIFIEIFLEEGWVGGLFFLCMNVLLLYRTLREGDTPEKRALFAMFFFFLVNSLVSGDVNDNKELFAFLALSLTFRSETRGISQSGTSHFRPSTF